MPSIRGRVLPVLLAATVVVGGANLAAYAANGRPVLLGNTNIASKTTTIKNSKGTALKIKSKSGTAPLKVSNTTKVTKLNADLVDGFEGSALQNKSYTYNLTGTSAAATLIRWALPGLPAGKYLVQFNVNATMSAAATFFGCVLDSGTPFVNSKLAQLGATSGSNTYFVSGGGYLDTTTLTYTLTCQSSAGTITVPGALSPASVTFTRTDDVTSAGSVGAKGTDSGKGFGN